ncbi:MULTISPECIES: hypothetical protein [Listeria]|uniref:hypothetical protein n=1 Tax=Listeria TaxID=1637 RepID=UPI000B596A46|nr:MULTISPECIES: hypothetical protein [Listeria]
MRIFIALLSFTVAVTGFIFQINTQNVVLVNIFSVSAEEMGRFGYICSSLMVTASILYLVGKNNRYLSLTAVATWGMLALVGFFIEPGYQSILFIRPITCALCIILALFVFIPSFKNQNQD